MIQNILRHVRQSEPQQALLKSINSIVLNSRVYFGNISPLYFKLYHKSFKVTVTSWLILADFGRLRLGRIFFGNGRFPISLHYFGSTSVLRTLLKLSKVSEGKL